MKEAPHPLAIFVPIVLTLSIVAIIAVYGEAIEASLQRIEESTRGVSPPRDSDFPPQDRPTQQRQGLVR